jgi:hypothetical protein
MCAEAAARIESDAARIRTLEAELAQAREQRGTLIASGNLSHPVYTPAGEMIRDLDRELAAYRAALAWVMRTHVRDLAIIDTRHKEAINHALDATPDSAAEQGEAK